MQRTLISIAIATALTSAPLQAQVLEEVMVTAQKREQSANDVGLSVTAFSNQQMEALGIEEATDVMAFTPGATLTTAGQGIPIYTIRGVGFDDYNSNSSSTVGINIDEVALPYPIMTRLPQYDIERLEILKGPQGTLYGLNTTGGTINFITAGPDYENSASIRMGYDSNQKITSQGFVNGALGENFAARGSFYVEQGGAWQNNAANGYSGGDHGDQKRLGLRLQGLWQPSDSVSVLLKADFHQDESDNVVPQFDRFKFINPDADLGDPGITAFVAGEATAAGLPDSSDPNAASWNPGGNTFGGQNPDGDFDRDNDGLLLTLRADWELESMTITSLTGFNDYSRNEANNWDGVAIRNWDQFNDTQIETFSQELRLTSTGSGPLTWIAGLYYAQDEVSEVSTGSGQLATSQVYVTPEVLGVDVNGDGIIDINDVTAVGFNFDLFSTQYDQDTRTAAVFGHMEYEFSPNWSAKLGLRYTDDEREMIDSCTYDVDGTLANFFTAAVFEGAVQYQQGDCVTLNPNTFESVPYNETLSTDNVTGQIGIDWRPVDDTLVYGLVSKGYKTGGFGAPAAASWTSLESYGEEEVLAYELGVKSTLFDGALQLNAAVYHYDYEDKQVSSFIIDPVFGALTKIINAPESTVQGFEMDLNWYATKSTLIRFATSYLDTEYDDFQSYTFGQSLVENPNPVDLSGSRIQNTPEWQHNLMVHHEIDFGSDHYAFLGGDWAYSDSFNTLVGNDPVFTVDSYSVLNVRGGFAPRDDRWRVTMWVTNVTDEDYFTALSPSNDANVRILGRERIYWASLQYNWN